jgi:hypothetical protein
VGVGILVVGVPGALFVGALKGAIVGGILVRTGAGVGKLVGDLVDTDTGKLVGDEMSTIVGLLDVGFDIINGCGQGLRS